MWPGICLWPFCLPWHKSAILLILYLLKILSSFEMFTVKIKKKMTICEPRFGLWPFRTLVASFPQSLAKDTGEMNSRRPSCNVSLVFTLVTWVRFYFMLCFNVHCKVCEGIVNIIAFRTAMPPSPAVNINGLVFTLVTWPMATIVLNNDVFANINTIGKEITSKIHQHQIWTVSNFQKKMVTDD